MEYTYLHTIHYPSDLKQLPLESLPTVCAEVRDFIIQELSHNPGHLGSSLGTVELTVAFAMIGSTSTVMMRVPFVRSWVFRKIW